MIELIWRRQPNETGLRFVCQSERGFELRFDGKILGRVSRIKWNGKFYFYGCGLNSLSGNKTYKTAGEAKMACKDHILSSDEYKELHKIKQEQQK